MWFLLVCSLLGPFAVGPFPAPVNALVPELPAYGKRVWIDHKPQKKDVALCLSR